MRSKIVEALVALALIAGVQAVLFRTWIADPRSILADDRRPTVDLYRVGVPPLGNDLTRLFLPHHLWTAREVRRTGRLPSWDERGFCGRPLIGNPQAGLFYPPVWIAWSVGPAAGLTGLTFAHLVWLGLGGWALGRTLGLSRFASIGAGVWLSACPYVLAQAAEGHLPHVWGFAWQPWAAACFVGARFQGRTKLWAVGSVASALGFLAGHPQEWFYFQLLVGWVVSADVALTRGRSARAWAGLLASWLLTIGLVAVELLPDLAVRRWAAPVAGSGLKDAGRYVVRPIHFLQLVDPTALGGAVDYRGPENYWEGLVSLGAVPLSLVIFAAIRSRTDRTTRICLVLVAFGLAFAGGPNGGVYTVCSVLPGVSLFRGPARMLFPIQIAAAVLVGKGLDRIKFKGLLILICGIGCAEMVHNADRILIFSPVSSWIHADPVAAHLAGERPRVRADDKRYDDLTAAVSEVEKLDVADSFQLEHVARLYRRTYRLTHRSADDALPNVAQRTPAEWDALGRSMLARLSVDAFVVPRGAPDFGLSATAEVDFGGPLVIRAVPDAVARVRLVPESERPPILHRLAPDRLEIEVDAKVPSRLLVAISWMPGWRAEIDGRSVAVEPGDDAQCSIPIAEPGAHRVRLEYHAPGFAFGLATTVASLTIASAFLARRPVHAGRIAEVP